MVACQVSHTIFKTPVKIARIRSNAYLDPAFSALYGAEIYQLTILSPEAEVSASSAINYVFRERLMCNIFVMEQ